MKTIDDVVLYKKKKALEHSENPEALVRQEMQEYISDYRLGGITKEELYRTVDLYSKLPINPVLVKNYKDVIKYVDD